MIKARSMLEIILMPIVVVFVGTLGTLVISSQQQESATRLGRTQLQAAREMAAADRQVQVLDLFAKKIASDDQNDRVVALRLLSAVDSDLALKLAAAVSEGEPVGSKVGKAAAEAVRAAGDRGSSFTIVGSFSTFSDADAMAKRLLQTHPEYPPSVYLSENGYYAVTLGGCLTLREALKRRDFARRVGIADDAYIKTSKAMGDNLLK